VAKKAVKVARKFQNDLPHALREAGLIAAMQGSIRKARQYLDESLAVAERQGARFEHARTLLARGRVGMEVGWPDAQEDLTAAGQTLRALGADWALGEAREAEPAAPAKTATLSLVDRFDTVLDAGRRIASALSRDVIFKEVCDAASGCCAASAACCSNSRAMPPPQNSPWCPENAKRNTAAPWPIGRWRRAGSSFFSEGQAEEEGALLAGVRSALCAPVFVRGKPAGCFYVDHRHVSGLFGEDEERLAEFIATIAGAALENAEGICRAAASE